MTVPTSDTGAMSKVDIVTAGRGERPSLECICVLNCFAHIQCSCMVWWGAGMTFPGTDSALDAVQQAFQCNALPSIAICGSRLHVSICIKAGGTLAWHFPD